MDFSKLFPIVEQAESGGNPNAISPKGAVGPMQTMPRTLRDPGYGVAPARNDTPEERRRVGQDYLKAMYSEYKGNLDHALVAYNWGPGNANKWLADGADFKKLPAETRNYVQKITAALGPTATPRTIDNAIAAVPSREQYDTAVAAGVSARFLRPSSSDPARFERALGADAEARAIQEATRPSTWEQFGAAVKGSGMLRAVDAIEHRLFDEKFPAVPGYVPDLKALPPTADDDLIEAYATATSPQAAERALRRFEEEQFRVGALMDSGAGKGVALSFAAELTGVQNWVVPFGVSKALGAAAAATIRGQVAENLLSGTAVEAATQALEGKFRPGELAISLAADSLIGVGIGAYAGRSAALAEAERITTRAMTEAAANELRLAERANAELVGNATVEAVASKAEELRAREVAEAAQPPSSRVATLIDEPETGRTVAGRIEDTGVTPVQRGGADSPEFKEWFGNSQAVTEDGAPRVVYHGTNASFEAFSKEALGSNTGATSAREGFFFAGSPDTTNAYVRAADDTSPNVMPAYLSMQNPKVYDMGGVVDRKRTYAGLLRQAKEEGRDGLIIRNTVDGGPVDDIYVVFEPTQIKSAISNSGAYSKTGPRIQFSGGVDTSLDLRKAVPDSLFRSKPARVVVAPGLSPDLQQAARAVESMAKFLPPGVRVAVGKIDSVTAKGAVLVDGKQVRLGLGQFGTAGGRGIETAMHEMTHAITDFYFPNVAPAIRQRVLADFAEFVKQAKAGEAEAVLMRWADKRSVPGGKKAVDTSNKYDMDFGEWMAEQGVRYFRQDAALANKAGFDKGIVATMKEWVASVWRWFTGAKELGHLKPTESFSEFMDAVVAGKVAPVANPQPTTRYSTQATPAEVVNELVTDPAAARYGIDLAPVATAADRAKAQAMLALHKKAEQWAAANPMGDAYLQRAKNLADNNVFNVASTGLTMLKSQSPLVRMIASELLEDASGVQAKRRPTAAIAKWQLEGKFLGNALNDIQGAYAFWKKGKPGGFKDDMIGGHNWAQFNKEIAAEREARKYGGARTQDPNVKAAADSLDAAYQRIANEQRRVGTLGSENLPLSSVGYMPHRMNAKAVLELSNSKKQVLHRALVDQFVTIEGWDISFSDMLASKYMQRVQARASGDYGSTIGGGNTSTASLVEEALRSMDLPADVIENHMKNYTKGAANFTKSRIDLDLNKVYNTPEGEFRLIDIFDTDQIALLRAQAGRASGEVALTQFGVQGKPGLQLLRDAMQYGADGARATNPEREAFDQIAAEFLNEPFGSQGGKWMERAMSANTLVRLGGIAFNQLAESINAVVHVGAANAARSVASIPRLRAEILALAKGQPVNNPFLTSIEQMSGLEFGTQAYKTVLPFDSPNHQYPTYGQDTLTLTDRILRGGAHAQAVLSGWRMLHSAQQRGMAEQIVKKIVRYVNEGREDVALRQFGVTPEMQQAIRRDLPQAAVFDAAGNPLGFDVTKITDQATREALLQSVWRGTAQIIQGTFIGETGKWAHDGWLKLLTQFRTFSITSMEKQWGRQRNSHGSFAAFGMLVGSMSMAIPIYMSRVYANSIGREDQEEYINQRLEPQHLARATLNYVAMSGMAGDFLDLVSATAPASAGLTPTGGRAGVETDFVGNYVAPAFSLVDDIWKYAQSPTDFHEAAKLLPGSRIPYLLPFVNSVPKDEQE